MATIMQPNTEFKNISYLKPGDVILCHCDPSKDLAAKAIHYVTSSEYCHAAIYYGDSLAAESTAKAASKRARSRRSRFQNWSLDMDTLQ